MDWDGGIRGVEDLVKIAVNGRFEGRRLTGVDRYATEITGCLDGRVRVVRPSKPKSGLRGHLWEQFILPRRVGRDELLWSPGNSGPISSKHQVVTIHDLSPLEHPEWFSTDFFLWYRLMLPRLARTARHVLTVSEHSRASIIRRLGVAPERVTAVPNGVNLSMFREQDPERVRRKYELPERYVLFVGSIDPRKNLGRLLAAWEQMGEEVEAQLVIVGAKGTIFRRVEMNPPERGVRRLGYVPDEDLPALYSGATFFVMPSLFEGFGLTVLEAMACGTPVVSSTGGALPEVADGAALQVDPTSVEELRAAMTRLLQDECLRSDLREKGLRRAREFSWQKAASRIGEVLAENA